MRDEDKGTGASRSRQKGLLREIAQRVMRERGLAPEFARNAPPSAKPLTPTLYYAFISPNLPSDITL